MNRVRVRPSKGISVMSMFAGIVCIGVGLFVVIPLAGGFGLLWTLFAAGITLFHAINAFSERGISTMEIESEGTSPPVSTPTPASLSFDERLRKLQQLHKEGLITEEEYTRKRQEIMDSDW